MYPIADYHPKTSIFRKSGVWTKKRSWFAFDWSLLEVRKYFFIWFVECKLWAQNSLSDWIQYLFLIQNLTNNTCLLPMTKITTFFETLRGYLHYSSQKVQLSLIQFYFIIGLLYLVCSTIPLIKNYYRKEDWV